MKIVLTISIGPFPINHFHFRRSVSPNFAPVRFPRLIPVSYFYAAFVILIRVGVNLNHTRINGAKSVIWQKKGTENVEK